jgi:hypothetical protein
MAPYGGSNGALTWEFASLTHIRDSPLSKRSFPVKVL